VLSSKHLSRNAILLALSLWLALLLVTHRGPMSPYSYIPQAGSALQVTRAGAEDALTVIPVTRFLYDGTVPDYEEAHNLRLPLHSFVVSVLMAFVRRYDVANELANLLFMIILCIAALRLADRYSLQRGAVLLGLATLFALPPIVGYIGQPMHYIVGPAVNDLVILVALAAGEKRLRNPLFAGALTAILCVNYDWYVFAAALGLYVLFVVRLESSRAAAVYLAVALAPAVAWNRLLAAMSHSKVSARISNTFVSDVVVEWLDFLTKPAARPMFPLAATQIGAHVAFHELIALIHWPLLLGCAIVLWQYRPAAPAPRAVKLLLLLVAIFAVEQLLTAAADWENNPRRALPVFLAFACAYCWAIHTTWHQRAWRITFVTLFALTSLVAFADVLISAPGATPLYMSENIRGTAKYALRYQNGRIDIAPELAPEQRVFRQPFPRAAVSGLGWAWLAANAFAAAALLLLFVLLARVELLPRGAPYACAAVIVLSVIRFLL
jgi:hypothetical protein